MTAAKNVVVLWRVVAAHSTVQQAILLLTLEWKLKYHKTEFSYQTHTTMSKQYCVQIHFQDVGYCRESEFRD